MMRPNSKMYRGRFQRLLLVGICLGEVACWQYTTQAEPSVAEEAPSFTRVVRPLLSNHCFACHGPDEENREAGIRLDQPGHVDLDEVVARITSNDPDLKMPPPAANKPLEENEIVTLQKWIHSGARYEKHWAFVPPAKPAVSADAHPVDYFLDRKLADSGITPTAQADASTRLRRVYLDLIGLPPPLELADRFMTNPTPAAYEKIVEELLASPRYGERWARRWLDLARYADTNGYEKDRDRSIWPYRDWVIRALNQGMPFDQFTIKQLAGDMLPEATAQQRVATGFHRNTMLNEEGGIDPLEFRYHAMTDRVATTGTTWLGLTTGCAQCHTHKYDPITHHDYFGMMAYLDNAEEPKLFLPTREELAQRQRDLLNAKELIQELPRHWPQPKDASAQPEQDFQQAFNQWLQDERMKQVPWHHLVATKLSANMPYLVLEPRGVILAGGDTSKHDIYTLEFPPSEEPITAIRLEALPDERLPGGGPGLTYYEGPEGDFYLTEFQVFDSQGSQWQIKSASETHSKNSSGGRRGAARLTYDGDIQSGWTIADRTGRRHVAVYNLTEPIPAGQTFTIRMNFGRHYASSLGKFRLSAANTAQEVQASPLTPEGAAALSADDPSENPELLEAFLMQSPQLNQLADRVHRLQHTKLGKSTLVMQERPAGQGRKTYLRNRGEYTQPEEAVEPRLPEALWPADEPPPENRLEFARWLVSRENPLTARVVANRQWAVLFGTGLVKTVSDFGMQGEAPSHPELLDFLAVELRDSGWSVKHLHRLIVTSEAYQRASAIGSSKEDPQAERLLARFPRVRLEAEIIRDSSLAASGLLNEKMFGPPVRPPQPAAARSANYKKSTWEASKGPDRYRRSIYTYQKRTAPFAMFTTFDGGSGEACLAQRDVSNTPLQALTLLNDPMFYEIAESYGQRMAQVAGEPPEKISTGFRWLLTRFPTSEELDLLLDFHNEHQNWTALARIILSLDESITKN